MEIPIIGENQGSNEPSQEEMMEQMRQELVMQRIIADAPVIKCNGCGNTTFDLRYRLKQIINPMNLGGSSQIVPQQIFVCIVCGLEAGKRPQYRRKPETNTLPNKKDAKIMSLFDKSNIAENDEE